MGPEMILQCRLDTAKIKIAFKLKSVNLFLFGNVLISEPFRTASSAQTTEKNEGNS